MNGKRYSRQRELIYQAVCDTTEHPTAEMVYQWLKPDNPALSLGTVYRNLNVLSEDGRLVRMPFPVERYDARSDRHSHFKCAKCGKVCDVELNELPMPSAEALSSLPHRVDHVEVTLYGVCADCRQSD